MIRLTIPSIEDDDLQAVCETLTSGYLVQGARVAAFEKAIASYVGCQEAIAVSNGTAALHLALLALEVQPGDIVLVPAYSWLATANVVELCGAQPIFVDIHPDTFNMDPLALESVLTRLMATPGIARRVRAILPVHAFGQLADMLAILELAQRYDIPVVEDAACAFGATLHERQAGTWGVMGCFSFHPRKAITTGEGGMIITNSPTLARYLRALRNHGQDPEALSTDFILPGFNYRLSEIQAAFGMAQFAKFDRILARRREVAQRYDEILATISVQKPRVTNGSCPVYQSYIVLLPECLAHSRSLLIQQLKEEGIETTIGTWHMPLTSYFQRRYGFRQGDFPVTDKVFTCSLALPIYERLTEHEQRYVVERLRKALARQE